MAQWPTLSQDARREDFQQYPLDDCTVRRISLDGKLKSRPAARPILYGYSFILRNLSPEDKEALETMQDTVQVGDEIIEWEDIRPSTASGGTGGVITVRLAEPMVFDLDDDGFGYRTEVHLEQEYE